MKMFIEASWPAAKNIFAGTTTRLEGNSLLPFDNFNLSHAVGEPIDIVMSNRRLLQEKLKLPSEPIWLNQQHTTNVINAVEPYLDLPADGSYANTNNVVCVALTADCLPVLLCNTAGTEIAALHAGWRGLADGIIEQGVKKFNSNASEILAWLGPAISGDVFEVGDEVREYFLRQDANSRIGFKPSRKKNHWLADVYQLARQQLKKLGVTKIYGGDFCTYVDEKKFYSFRRDNITGRMASIIYSLKNY